MSRRNDINETSTCKYKNEIEDVICLFVSLFFSLSSCIKAKKKNMKMPHSNDIIHSNRYLFGLVLFCFYFFRSFDPLNSNGQNILWWWWWNEKPLWLILLVEFVKLVEKIIKILVFLIFDWMSAKRENNNRGEKKKIEYETKAIN